jgi:hypothetical protein
MEQEQIPLLADEELPNDIYAEGSDEELHYVGSLKVSLPLPIELYVEYLGFTYVYKLDRRYKDPSQ